LIHPDGLFIIHLRAKKQIGNLPAFFQRPVLAHKLARPGIRSHEIMDHLFFIIRLQGKLQHWGFSLLTGLIFRLVTGSEKEEPRNKEDEGVHFHGSYDIF
jgi:hypothetical protein